MFDDPAQPACVTRHRNRGGLFSVFHHQQRKLPMIAIIYIPHQSKPYVEFYDSEHSIHDAAEDLAMSDGDAPEEFDDDLIAIDYLTHDMHRSIVVRHYDDIAELDEYKGHQSQFINGRIAREVRECFENYTIEGQIVAKAREDAELFTDEFPGLDLNTHGDWDSQAWEETARQMGFSPEEEEFHWPRYREALISEIAQLNAI